MSLEVFKSEIKKCTANLINGGIHRGLHLISKRILHGLWWILRKTRLQKLSGLVEAYHGAELGTIVLDYQIFALESNERVHS